METQTESNTEYFSLKALLFIIQKLEIGTDEILNFFTHSDQELARGLVELLRREYLTLPVEGNDGEIKYFKLPTSSNTEWERIVDILGNMADSVRYLSEVMDIALENRNCNFIKLVAEELALKAEGINYLNNLATSPIENRFKKIIGEVLEQNEQNNNNQSLASLASKFGQFSMHNNDNKNLSSDEEIYEETKFGYNTEYPSNSDEENQNPYQSDEEREVDLIRARVGLPSLRKG